MLIGKVQNLDRSRRRPRRLSPPAPAFPPAPFGNSLRFREVWHEGGRNVLMMPPSGESGSLYCDYSGVIDFSGGKSYFASLPA
jgi:hypothetical protein